MSNNESKDELCTHPSKVETYSIGSNFPEYICLNCGETVSDRNGNN